MDKWTPPERRGKIENGFVPRPPFLIRMSCGHAWAFVVLGTCLIGIADIFTAQAMWFGPVYLLIVGLAAWMLGWPAAIGVGLACLGITLSVNRFKYYPYDTSSDIWNLFIYILAMLMIIGILNYARIAYAGEWRRARTDPLTGAFNRQAFFELTEAMPHSHSWNMLAYADLDGLKKINDEFGHDMGDECLRTYADHVRRIIRHHDVFVRIGGDEFLVYMAVKDEDAGKVVAARLHHEMNLVTSLMNNNLRCSIGVLLLAPGIRLAGREVSMADELMYDAKKCGAALAIATAHERKDSMVVTPHWHLVRSFANGQPAEPEQGMLALVYPDRIADENMPRVIPLREGARIRPSRRTAA